MFFPNIASSCPKNLSTIPGGGTSMLVVGIVIAVLTIFVVSLKSSADGMGGVTDVGMISLDPCLFVPFTLVLIDTSNSFYFS